MIRRTISAKTDRRRRRFVWLAGAAALLCAACSSPSKKPKETAAVRPPEGWTEIYALDYGEYAFHFGHVTPEGETYEDYYFMITRNGEPRAVEMTGVHTKVLDVENPGDAVSAERPEIKDITGDGVPELVIEFFTGGAHCCMRYWIYSLGDSLTRTAYLESEYRYVFNDLDGDGTYELEGVDDTFDYWQAPHALSPMPRVILTFAGGRHRLAEDLMRQPPPPPAAIGERAARVRTEIGRAELTSFQPGPWSGVDVPPSLWGTMLEWIYQGNAPAAFEFFDQAWRDRLRGKAAFKEAFLRQLSTSPHWDDLKAMNPVLETLIPPEPAETVPAEE